MRIQNVRTTMSVKLQKSCWRKWYSTENRIFLKPHSGFVIHVLIFLVEVEGSILKSLMLKWFSTRSDFPPQRTFANACRHFWLLRLKGMLVTASGSRLGMLLKSYNAWDGCPQQRMTWPNVSNAGGWETLAYETTSHYFEKSRV